MDIRGIYKLHVAQKHKSKVVREYFSLYAWFWFHFEALWIKDPLERRPLTFIMRDWIYPHMKWFVVILVVWYAGMFTWMHWNSYAPAVFLVLSSWLAAHLIWGSPWIYGQQECPQIEDI